ncbi:MAG: L-alanine exporter AlaE [Nanoarchaeota archaeon]
MPKNLEEKISEKKLKKFSLRKFGTDTFAMVSFSFVVEGTRELIVGMSPEQTLYSRLAGVPIDLVIGRPYGKYLDYLQSKFKITEKSPFIKKTAVDIGAFVSAMMPIYAGILYSIGVDKETIAVSCASAALLQTAYGRPYGLYVDFLRKKFGKKNIPII